MILIAALLASAGSIAADAPKDPERARCTQYDADRARCMSGTTGQDQASCLESAGAAYDSTRPKRHHPAFDVAKTKPTPPSR